MQNSCSQMSPAHKNLIHTTILICLYLNLISNQCSVPHITYEIWCQQWKYYGRYIAMKLNQLTQSGAYKSKVLPNVWATICIKLQTTFHNSMGGIACYIETNRSWHTWKYNSYGTGGSRTTQEKYKLVWNRWFKIRDGEAMNWKEKYGGRRRGQTLDQMR